MKIKLLVPFIIRIVMQSISRKIFDRDEAVLRKHLRKKLPTFQEKTK